MLWNVAKAGPIVRSGVSGGYQQAMSPATAAFFNDTMRELLPEDLLRRYGLWP